MRVFMMFLIRYGEYLDVYVILIKIFYFIFCENLFLIMNILVSCFLVG